MSQFHELRTKCYVSTHWPVEPFEADLEDICFVGKPVRFSVSFHDPGFVEPEQNLTVITIRHEFEFDGDYEEFVRWGVHSDGGPEVVRHVIKIINHLVDLIISRFQPQSATEPECDFPYVRHIGMRDLVHIAILTSKGSHFFATGMITTDSRMAAISAGMVTRVDYPLREPLPRRRLRLLRAIELLDHGYITEALLVAFALLDSEVQDRLTEALKDKSIVEPCQLLRVITQDRVSTFLGPLMKLVAGHSLEEDRPGLWKHLQKANRLRNQAIHESRDADYNDVKTAIVTIRDILVYLDSVGLYSSSEKECLGGLPLLLGTEPDKL